MDDIKLFAKNEKVLETFVQAVRIYREDIGREFGIEKCAVLIMKSEKWQMTEVIELTNQRKTRKLGEIESYEHLEISEADTIKQTEMKEKEIKTPQNKKTTRKQTT